jgi:hypothetical protein
MAFPVRASRAGRAAGELRGRGADRARLGGDLPHRRRFPDGAAHRRAEREERPPGAPFAATTRWIAGSMSMPSPVR